MTNQKLFSKPRNFFSVLDWDVTYFHRLQSNSVRLYYPFSHILTIKTITLLVSLTHYQKSSRSRIQFLDSTGGSLCSKCLANTECSARKPDLKFTPRSIWLGQIPYLKKIALRKPDLCNVSPIMHRFSPTRLKSNNAQVAEWLQISKMAAKGHRGKKNGSDESNTLFINSEF